MVKPERLFRHRHRHAYDSDLQEDQLYPGRNGLIYQQSVARVQEELVSVLIRYHIHSTLEKALHACFYVNLVSNGNAGVLFYDAYLNGLKTRLLLRLGVEGQNIL